MNRIERLQYADAKAEELIDAESTYTALLIAKSIISQSVDCLDKDDIAEIYDSMYESPIEPLGWILDRELKRADHPDDKAHFLNYLARLLNKLMSTDDFFNFFAYTYGIVKKRLDELGENTDV